MIRLNVRKLFFLIIGLFGLYFFLPIEKKEHSPPSMLSVSSDGKYVISAHHGNYLILWNIAKKTKKIISKSANIYSPYFVKNTDKFIWQDLKTNSVYVQDINLREIKRINPGFQVFGHILKENLETYIASDVDWNLFQFEKGQKYTLKRGFGDFKGYGKLLNLSTVKDIVLSSGSCGYKGESLPISAGLAASDKYKDITPNAFLGFVRLRVTCTVLKSQVLL